MSIYTFVKSKVISLEFITSTCTVISHNGWCRYIRSWNLKLIVKNSLHVQLYHILVPCILTPHPTHGEYKREHLVLPTGRYIQYSLYTVTVGISNWYMQCALLDPFIMFRRLSNMIDELNYICVSNSNNVNVYLCLGTVYILELTKSLFFLNKPTDL